MSANEIDISKKTEELSLVESLQKNPMMTHFDKIKTYSKLYELYD